MWTEEAKSTFGQYFATHGRHQLFFSKTSSRRKKKSRQTQTNIQQQRNNRAKMASCGADIAVNKLERKTTTESFSVANFHF